MVYVRVYVRDTGQLGMAYVRAVWCVGVYVCVCYARVEVNRASSGGPAGSESVAQTERPAVAGKGPRTARQAELCRATRGRRRGRPARRWPRPGRDEQSRFTPFRMFGAESDRQS